MVLLPFRRVAHSFILNVIVGSELAPGYTSKSTSGDSFDCVQRRQATGPTRRNTPSMDRAIPTGCAHRAGTKKVTATPRAVTPRATGSDLVSPPAAFTAGRTLRLRLPSRDLDRLGGFYVGTARAADGVVVTFFRA